MQIKNLETIVKQPKQPATATVIWLHGLGASGDDFASILPQLQLPDDHAIRFIFPHAPVRPVTINANLPCRAWYDIFSLASTEREDKAGILQTDLLLQQLIKHQIDNGIASHRIMLVGFSQGGAMALYSALHYPQKLAGVLGLSCYLPLAMQLVTENTTLTNQQLPILLMHGERDDVLPMSAGEQSYAFLKKLNYPVQWKSYPMGHEVCLPQINAIRGWFLQQLNK